MPSHPGGMAAGLLYTANAKYDARGGSKFKSHGASRYQKLLLLSWISAGRELSLIYSHLAGLHPDAKVHHTLSNLNVKPDPAPIGCIDSGGAVFIMGYQSPLRRRSLPTKHLN
jgi:hypothetical protein